MKNKNQKKKEATKEAKTKTPKPKEYLGDQASSKECPNCHKVLPLTTEHWWIYRDLRKGPKIEDNVYYPNCRKCYKKYRAELKAKGPTPRKTKDKVAPKKQSSKKRESKQTPETTNNIVARKASLDHSPFFLVNSKDEVKKITPTKIGAKRNHIYIVKNWRE